MSNKSENIKEKSIEDELNEILIPEKPQGKFKVPGFKEKLIYSWKRYKNELEEERVISASKGIYPRGLFLMTNKINNTKFSWYSFIFIFLYQEFSDFSNLYFLFLTITQFFPALSVGFLISYIFPLACILTFRAFEELYQHFRIKNRDKKLNLRKYKKLQNQNGKFTTSDVRAENLKVGDIIIIGHERVPADVLILHSQNPSVYVKTDQIDGETDLKVRKSIKRLQEKFEDDQRQYFDSFEVVLNPNQIDLNHFGAIMFYLDIIESSGKIKKEPLTLENTIWSGCSISNNQIIGLVIATGQDTRLAQNSKNIRRIKNTSLDGKVNIFAILLFVMMISVSMGNAIFQGTLSYGFMAFCVSSVRFTILLSFLIPISLRLFLMLG